MGEIIGRAVSRKTAIETLRMAIQYMPKSRIDAYAAALNRVTYEFKRHEPVSPTNDNRCGYCGNVICVRGAAYCWNCGREIKR